MPTKVDGETRLRTAAAGCRHPAGLGSPGQRTRATLSVAYVNAAAENRHAVVGEYRLDRRHGGPNPHHLPHVPGVDFRGRLGFRRPRSGNGQPDLHGAAVRLRARPRVRPYLHRARVRRGDARRDPASDRRRGAARAHSGKAERGILDRHCRPAGQCRDRAGADAGIAGAPGRPESRRGGEHQRLAGRSPGGGQPVPRAVQPDPRLSHGRRPRAARPAGDPPRLCPRHRGRGHHRAVVRLRARLRRPVLQSAAHLHRDLRLSRRLVRGAGWYRCGRCRATFR